MTRLYLDTEFNSHGGDLISIALVTPLRPQHPMIPRGPDMPEATDTFFYEACLCKGPIDPWVIDHVMPKLKTSQLLPSIFRRDFHNWIRQFNNPEIICDWHADAEHFCRLLAGSDYGSSLDFACRITILKTPPGQPVSADPHNALADARALRDWHEQILASAA